uniref:tRNA selenocysteine-associated protein 1 n=1 Tax=Lygus hesperus TaxID=30085 RepID=A0A0A9WVD5_LYGHE
MAQTANMVHCQLWMGGLEPYMTESFILASFQRMGEKPLNVKVMRNKFSGEPAGYCFVHFENDDEAIDAMHKLNGKVIPNTNPAVRFRLNTASNQGKIVMNDREFSLWVGDLSQEVDDYTLYKCFAAKYQSIKAAKVILDASGYSKGFGFLRFGLEEEQKHCLAHMNGYKGLGSKPLKISNAIPKSQRGPNTNGPPMPQQSGGYQYPPDYSNYYDPNYWQHYGQWGGYGYDPNTGNYQYDPNYAAQYGNQYPGQYNQYPPPTNQYPQQNYPYSHPPYPYYPPQTPAAPVPSAAPPVAPPAPSIAPVDDSNEVVGESSSLLHSFSTGPQHHRRLPYGTLPTQPSSMSILKV